MKAIALKKSSRIQCGSASIFEVTPLARAWGTLLAPAQFHNSSLADPHTWQAPAQNAALLEESNRIGLDPSEWRGECPENGALEPSHCQTGGVTRYQKVSEVLVRVILPQQNLAMPVTVCSLCGVHKTKVRGFKIHASAFTPINPLASKVLEKKKLNFLWVWMILAPATQAFRLIDNFDSEQQLLRLFEALFGYYRRMHSCHIHLNCTDIKIWKNFQEGIPILVEAAAQFSDFQHIINQIKEKN